MNLTDLYPTESEIPAAHQLSAPIKQQEYLIGGKLLKWAGPEERVFSPVCLHYPDRIEQKFIGTYPLCSKEVAQEALESAASAWNFGRGDWPTATVAERIQAVSKFASLMRNARTEVINLLMWEIGKNHADSCKEFDRTVAYIEDTIEALKDLDRVSSRFQIAEGIIGQIRRAPLGVTLCMGPFNYPLNETFTTLIPALIMGNPVVFKPAKYGVLLLRPLLEAFQRCFPPGVVNTLYGDGRTVVPPIMESGLVDVLAFIGSASTSSAILKQHPQPHRLRNVLGLNAKNPAIILKDADLEQTVAECVLGSLSFNGQRCTALKILFVEQDIVDKFLAQFSNAVDKLKLGMPWDEGVQITPLPEDGKTRKMCELVEDALAKGAKVINSEGGSYSQTLYKPAVVYPVTSAMRLYSEEQFGPIVPIVPFRDLNAPLAYIAESSFGQQASIFSTNPERIAKLIDFLTNQVCRVNLNSQCQRGPDVFPFTGRKDSAEGTLSVTDALRVFSIRTLVASKKGDLNTKVIKEILEERMSSFLNTDFLF